MLGRRFTYKEVQFPYTAQEGYASGWYADVKWKTISTRTTVIDKQNYHGAFTSPTLAGARLITVSGQIFSADKETRGLIRKNVDNIFILEGIPTLDAGIYELEIRDDDNNDWIINAQVYSMPDYDNDRGNPIINFNCELLAADPIFRSKTITNVYGIYGLFGGSSLPITLPDGLGGSINIIETANTGNFASPPVITITGDIVNPKIIALHTGQYWKQLRTISSGDSLVIDTGTQTVTYNGVDDIANRGSGSVFPFITPGNNYFILTGDDFDYDSQSKAQVHISFRSTML